MNTFCSKEYILESNQKLAHTDAKSITLSRLTWDNMDLWTNHNVVSFGSFTADTIHSLLLVSPVRLTNELLGEVVTE